MERFERSQLFQPVKYPGGNWRPVAKLGVDATFAAEDGTQLHGWFLEHPNPRAVILLAHGNAGNLTHRVLRVWELRERHRVSVMVFDYRGYGKSEGEPDERGVLQDARAARKWLAERAGVSERDIVLMGRSLGGGVMVDLAANDGARGLVLESTFTSLPDVARNVMPLLPVGWLMTNRLDSLSKIARYHGPLLQSHGDADQLIPIAQAHKLHAAATGRKQFVTIEGGGHNSRQSEEYQRKLDAFIASLPG